MITSRLVSVMRVRAEQGRHVSRAGPRAKVRESGGSHVVFSHSSCPTVLTVPARRPIKPVYIRLFVGLVDEISEAS